MGAAMMSWRLQDKVQHIHMYMRDGKLAWEGGDGSEGPVWWGKDERFVCDVTIDSSMVLLDLSSVASVPFPQIKLRCEFDRKTDDLVLKCIEAGEPYAKGLGEATLFSIDLFRRLLVQGYEWRLTVLTQDDVKSVIRLYHR